MIPDPYRTPAAHLHAAEKALTCPYCEQTFLFTWRRYFKLRQVCPHCGRRSKFSGGAGYWLVYIPLIGGGPPAIAFVGSAMISMVLMPEDPLWIVFETHAMVGIWAVMFLLGFPIDRAVDLNLRKLVPMSEKVDAA